MKSLSLGEATSYPQEYAPELLFPDARSEARSALGLGEELPFHGADLWTAWELTWLDAAGKPAVATVNIVVDAASPRIIESKSLKLYLNSLAMTQYASWSDLRAVIVADLSRTAASDVDVTMASVTPEQTIATLPGTCVDDLQMTATPTELDAGLLRCQSDAVVCETLHSHLLRSNCPVTDQPDCGSVLVRYEGPKIDPAALLTYIVSFRRHNDFHEACVERMFVDIRKHCAPAALTVYARYNRRGGIDINPFRSNFEGSIENMRLWRQ